MNDNKANRIIARTNDALAKYDSRMVDVERGLRDARAEAQNAASLAFHLADGRVDDLKISTTLALAKLGYAFFVGNLVLAIVLAAAIG